MNDFPLKKNPWVDGRALRFKIEDIFFALRLITVSKCKQNPN